MHRVIEQIPFLPKKNLLIPIFPYLSFVEIYPIENSRRKGPLLIKILLVSPVAGLGEIGEKVVEGRCFGWTMRKSQQKILNLPKFDQKTKLKA